MMIGFGTIVCYWLIIRAFISKQPNTIEQFMSYLFANAAVQFLISLTFFIDFLRIFGFCLGFLSFALFLYFTESIIFPLMNDIFVVYCFMSYHFALVFFIHRMLCIQINRTKLLFFPLLFVDFSFLLFSQYLYPAWWRQVQDALIYLIFIQASYLFFILICFLDIDEYVCNQKIRRINEFNEIYLNQ